MNSHPTSAGTLASRTHAHRTLAWSKRIGFTVLLALSTGGMARLAINQQHGEELRQRTLASLPRSVITVHPKPAESGRRIGLPATLRGNTETQIFARCDGYLSAWYKNIGDQVSKGELLAVIDVPELDQELAQAKATVAQVRTRLDLARSTWKRWKILSQNDSATPQEYDEKRSAALQAEADLAAAEANVKRLQNLEGYRHIIAPFAGVITRRSIDVGNLITAGNQELFALTQTDPLRLTVQVPQIYSADIQLGGEVTITFPEIQGKPRKAHIEHIAGALDPMTRTRQVDVILDNKDGRLLPGAYADVSLTLTGNSNSLIVPANVLVIEAEGPHVVTVDGKNRIRFRRVGIGRDFGREVEVLEGISLDDTLVASPSDLLVDGESVRTAPVAGRSDTLKTAGGR